ncbi:hypothetical protein MYMA111404_00775 [Mycoplasma marinum]
MKLGIIIDSSSGLTQKETNDKGWGYFPLHIFIDGKDFREGIDITNEEVCKVIDINTKTKTSVTSPGEIMNVLEGMKDSFDHILILTISSKLSSQFSNVSSLTLEDEKVTVFDTKAVSIGIELMANRAVYLAKNGQEIKSILEQLEIIRKNNMCLVIPKQLEWLVKGGRVNKKIASMANMLKIVPIIKLEDGELSKHGKGRTFEKTIMKSAKEIFNNFPKNNLNLSLVHSGNANVQEYSEKISEKFNVDVSIKMLPSSIIMHIGLGAIVLFAWSKILN